MRNRDGSADHQADKKRFLQFLVAEAFFKTRDDKKKSFDCRGIFGVARRLDKMLLDK